MRTLFGLLILILIAGPVEEASSQTPPPAVQRAESAIVRVTAAAPDSSDAPRNVIFFIPDGLGPASITMARDFKGQRLTVDDLIVGITMTGSTSSRVTDSAAGATAYASGIKTYNGAIGVDDEKRPVGTVVEAAEARGMATGLIATSRITHATPACYSAHVPARSMEAEIADQQIRKDIDVLLGGGRSFFEPKSSGGRRADDRNLIDEAKGLGYTIVSNKAEMEAVQSGPVLGLFTQDHMAYEIDRDPAVEPSLAEMTQKALDILSEDEDGFFLMVEASRIDHAAHGNDAASHLHDILAFDEAVAVALEFAKTDGNTLLVSSADHETGGLSLGRNINGSGVYAWKPQVLAQVKSSLGGMISTLTKTQDPEGTLSDMAGIEVTEVEQTKLEAAGTEVSKFYRAFSEIISERAVVGWTTGGHTAVDVNLMAYGPGSDEFVGAHENSEVGQIVLRLLGLDLAPITEALRSE